VLYRIVTQNKNRSNVMTLLRRHFDGFTMYRATGVYTDKVGTHIEPALIIEIDSLSDVIDSLSDIFLDGKIIEVVNQIKKMNQQDNVLLQRIKTNSELV